VNVDEQRRILEEIARDSSNPNARVSAIRALRRLEEAEAKEDPPQSADFADLDACRERRHTKGPKSA
jgi:hypothetical protein